MLLGLKQAYKFNHQDRPYLFLAECLFYALACQHNKQQQYIEPDFSQEIEVVSRPLEELVARANGYSKRITQDLNRFSEEELQLFRKIAPFTFYDNSFDEFSGETVLYWTKIKKHLIIVVMKLTNEETQKIEQLLRDSSYAKYHKRLQIIYFRSKGKSYKEIMDLLDCNKTTVWRNLKKYKEFGLEALLQETRGGRHREYMTYEEEQAFLKRHIEAAQAGEFVTVNQLFEAYQKEIGRTSTRDGFYYLLKRHGWRTVTPRPEHPKKADAQRIETSKNKIYIRDLK